MQAGIPYREIVDLIKAYSGNEDMAALMSAMALVKFEKSLFKIAVEEVHEGGLKTVGLSWFAFYAHSINFFKKAYRKWKLLILPHLRTMLIPEDAFCTIRGLSTYFKEKGSALAMMDSEKNGGIH